MIQKFKSPVSGFAFLFFSLVLYPANILFPIGNESRSSEKSKEKAYILEQKLLSALESHPEFLSLEESAKAYYYDSETKGILPDSKIGLAYRSYPVRGKNPLAPDLKNREDLPAMSGREWMISQEIPYPEKLRSEKKIAYWSYLSEKERVALAKNELIRDLYLLLIEKSILENEIRDWKSVLSIQTSLSRISNAGFITGRESTYATLRDQNDLLRTKEKLIDLETDLSVVNASIDYFISLQKSSSPNQVSASPQLWEDMQILLDTKIGSLIEKARENPEQLSLQNPNSKRLETEIQLALENENRDNLTYFPDSEIFIAYMERNSKLFRVSQNPINSGSIMPSDEFSGDLLSFGVTLRVPTWSWSVKQELNQKNRSEKTKELQAKKALDKKLSTEIFKLVQSIQGAERMIEYYEKELLPSLERSSRIQAGSGSSTGDSGSILRLRMEYQTAVAIQNDLKRKKYQSIVSLLELTNELTQPITLSQAETSQSRRD